MQPTPFLIKAGKIPDGEPFAQLTRSLFYSPAWRVQSGHSHKLISFLLLEHMNHAGLENGKLMATYNQLINYGIQRGKVSKAINEAEALGLIKVERGIYRGLSKNNANSFTLTFLPAIFQESPRLYSSPTNDWQYVGNDAAEAIAYRYDKRRGKQK